MIRLPLAFILLSWLAGCGLDSANALTLDSATDARVSGQFAAPAPIDFVLERDGGREHLVVTDYAGSPLLEATLAADGRCSTRLLAGRVDAEAELAALPEAQSLAALGPALVKAHIATHLPCGSN